MRIDLTKDNQILKTYFLPKLSPSAIVSGNAFPAVSGNMNVGRADSKQSSPNINIRLGSQRS